MSGHTSRNKGSGFERTVAKTFSNKFGVEYRRTPLSGGWAKGSKTAAGDLVPLDAPQQFCIECKKVEGWTFEQLFSNRHALFSSWWKQLIEECPEGVQPVLVFSKNRSQIYIAIRKKDVIAYPFTYMETIEGIDNLIIMPLDFWITTS